MLVLFNKAAAIVCPMKQQSTVAVGNVCVLDVWHTKAHKGLNLINVLRTTYQ